MCSNLLKLFSYLHTIFARGATAFFSELEGWVRKLFTIFFCTSITWWSYKQSCHTIQALWAKKVINVLMFFSMTLITSVFIGQIHLDSGNINPFTNFKYVEVS